MRKWMSIRVIVATLIAGLTLFSTPTDICSSEKTEQQMAGWKNKRDKKLGRHGPKINQSQLISTSLKLQERITHPNLTRTSDPAGPDLRQTLQRKGRHPIDLSNALPRNRRTGDWKIHWRDGNGTPRSVTGAGPERNLWKRFHNESRTETAFRFLAENRDVFLLERPQDELRVLKETSDEFGKHHIKFQETYGGIAIWGHDIVVHFEPSGDIYAINAHYAPTTQDLDVTNISISSSDAIRIASRELGSRAPIITFDAWQNQLLGYDGPSAEKYIWIDDRTQERHLIWHVRIRPTLRDNWFYFVDARTGDILEKYNATAFDGPATASATDLNAVSRTINVYNVGSTFYMIDGSRSIFQPSQPDLLNDPIGALWTIDLQGNDVSRNASFFNVTSTNNTWNDAVSVSAHYNVGEVFKYFFNTHNREAIDGNGTTIISVIHVTDNNQPMDNAYWNGVFMAYGDGSEAFTPLAGGLDVAAHEMSHGVIQSTVNLEYKFQSGALNESFADVFGVMVDRDDWKIGEDVVLTAVFPSGALRDIEDPHNGGNSISDTGWQPAHMNEFLDLTIDQDNGGVHINSGIANRACFLIANAIGREATERIYYRILDALYLNAQSNFVDMRLAAIRAATDLFGDPSAQVDAVRAGFDGVGIGGDNGAKPPADHPSVTGQQWVAMVNTEEDDNSLYLVKPVIVNTATDIVLLTSTQVLTASASPVAVTDNGAVILFIDSANNIRIINSDGSNEELIDARQVWSSIALSPDGTKLAATTIFVDARIYIFDFAVPSKSKIVELYSPTTGEGNNVDVVQFADALDWDLSGQMVIYDAFNVIPQAGGSAIEYWDVNVLDVENEIIFSIFGSLPDGISAGNPSFSQTNSNYFVFDLVDFNLGRDDIMAVDLFAGELSAIFANGTSIGFPKYSPDDSRVVFQYIDGSVNTIRQVPVENKVQAGGPSEQYIFFAVRPAWFAMGERVLDFDPPNLGVSVLGGTVTPNYLAVYVSSDELLSGGATATLKLTKALGEPVVTNKTLRSLPNHDPPVYYTQYALTDGGQLQIEVVGIDKFGNKGSVTRTLNVAPISASSSFQLVSRDGDVTLRADKGSVVTDGFVLLEEHVAFDALDDAPKTAASASFSLKQVGGMFRVVSTVSLVRDVAMVVKYDERELGDLMSENDYDEGQIGLYRFVDDKWQYVGGEGFENEVRVRVDELGLFVLFYNSQHEILPAALVLQQNYPNPFNPTTTIRFALPSASHVKLNIYNVLGQRVRTLVNEPRVAGFHSVLWDGRNNGGALVATGVYLYRLELDQRAFTKKMLLLK